MLWIWLLLRNSHNWVTGPLERWFTFLCAHCGASVPAMVRTFGSATGPNLVAAQQKAHANADAFAHRAVMAAACPGCGQLQPAVLAQLALAEKRLARRKAWRLPVAVVIALAVAALIAIPAVADLRHSSALCVVAFCAAVAAGSALYAILSLQLPLPQTFPAGVWFSRDPSQGPASWVPAQPGPVRTLEQPRPASRIAGFSTAGVMGVATIIALVLWGKTFRKVHVVSTEGANGDLVVRIDGAEVGQITPDLHPQLDAPSATYEVRTGSAHHVVVVDADGRELTYDLDPASAPHGWVIAPHARERDLCLASITWYYGPKLRTDDDRILNDEGAGDLVPLQRRFDHVFTSPPKTIQTKQISETRSSLRALDCEAMDENEVVPWKARVPARPPATPL